MKSLRRACDNTNLIQGFGIKLILIAFILPLFTSCGGSGKVTDGQIQIDGALTGCFADSVFLMKVIGNEAEKVGSAGLVKEGTNATFTLNIKLDQPGLYLLGTGPRTSAKIILGTESPLKFSADCQKIAESSSLTPSAENDNYWAFQNKISGYNQQLQQLSQNLRIFQMTNPGAVPNIQADMKRANDGKAAAIDSAITLGGVVAKAAALSKFPQFGSDPAHSAYSSELDYFAATYFGALDLSDLSLANIPQLNERAQGFGQTLGQTMGDQALPHFQAAIEKAPVGSDNRRVIYMGILTGLEQAKKDIYLTLADSYLKEFPKPSNFSSRVVATTNRMKATAVGATPPTLILPTPDGDNFDIASLKGQYVLLDFWASWCKPCRKENPNVKKVYDKYHKKGFEIVGVSLDKEKGRWLAAIEQDGLQWKHISDLAAWQSKAAQDYGVSSIPMTFLLDKEGKIMAKGLRGSALESKLEEIFGS